jgi:DNA-binding NtrC family response regulator
MSTGLNNLVSFVDSRPRAATTARTKPPVFADPASQMLLKQIERLAPSDASVLILGESGTGKEVIARHIHAHGGRNGPFVAINCGALSPTLAEAELFGHEAGAYTGASGARAGWFEAADSGTLFLDEIADLSPALQVKLLRVLQEREVVRIGSRKTIPVDVRLVAATNVDLGEAVAAGRFRLDLFYRLNVASIALAPLRDRRGDILPLAEHFLRMYSERLRMPLPRLLPDTQRALLAHAWPGNLRELENVVHVALLMSTDDTIRPEHLRFANLPRAFAAATPTGTLAASSRESAAPSDGALDSLLPPLERLFNSPPAELFPKLEELIVRRAYDFCHGNQVQSARLLGISRNVLRTHLKRFHLISPLETPS